MTTIISRLYADREQAAGAAAALRRPFSMVGFGASEITTVTPDARDEARVRHAVAGAGVAARDVAPLTGAILGGASLVVVRAPFGRAYDAMEILDGFGPLAAGAGAGEHDPGGETWHEAAPLSRALGLPVLLPRRDETVAADPPAAVPSDWELSKVFGLPLLVADDHGAARVSHDPAPFSRALRLPVLRPDPSPRTSLGAPTLAPDDWTLSKAMGIPLLVADDHPKVGLFHDPAPLSRLLGIPTLI